MLAILPTEILLQIFAELNYLALKCDVPAVCKRFRAVVHNAPVTGKFVTAFHRGGLTSESFRKRNRSAINESMQLGQTPRNYKLHPCLRMIKIRATNSGSRDVEIRNGFKLLPISCTGFYSKSGRWISITETELLNENVTSPAADVIVLNQVDDTPMRRVVNVHITDCSREMWSGYAVDRDSSPVRVKDLLKTLGEAMLSSTSYHRRSWGMNSGSVFRDGKPFRIAKKLRFIKEGTRKGLLAMQYSLNIWPRRS